jgi:tRNA-uridine 2-sulfurtransferase
MGDKKHRVVVAMSGGVDSSVAAALLVEAGFEVIGIMLKLWSEPGLECENRCCTPDSEAMARRVAAKIGIPIYTIDAKEPFYKYVVTSFIDGYLNGTTPNPCGVCNQFIRWDFLLSRALELDAHFLATGHYARRIKSPQGQYLLLRGIDYKKDQSYILYSLTQSQLSHALFPLGNFNKPQVREMARAFDLPVAEKPDSQDLCFIGNGSYQDFLLRQSNLTIKPGPIKDLNGQIIGEHKGLSLYTIGQRKGLGISGLEPQYVLLKDALNNAIIIGPKSSLGRNDLQAEKINWVNGIPHNIPFTAQAQIRYKAPAIHSTIIPHSYGGARVEFSMPLRDITPGQIITFYNGEECLGGGIIR